jgi:hypothetical protein
MATTTATTTLHCGSSPMTALPVPALFPFPTESLYATPEESSAAEKRLYADEVLPPPDDWELHRSKPMAFPTQTVGEWLRDELCGVQNWMLCLVVTLAEAAYGRVVASYPWRERALMAAYLPRLVSEASDCVTRGRTHPILRGDVDAILPSLRVLVPTRSEQLAVEADLRAYLGERPPLSRLQAYEAIYAMVTSGRYAVSPATRALFCRVFAPS